MHVNYFNGYSPAHFERRKQQFRNQKTGIKEIHLSVRGYRPLRGKYKIAKELHGKDQEEIGR
jgi:hypothetical protein